MEQANIHRIEELQKSLGKDNTAAKDFFQLFAKSMYAEARLYIQDTDVAKKACIQAFRNSLAILSDTDAEDVEGLLKHAVQNECIRNIAFEASVTPYSSDDEVPDSNADVFIQNDKIIAALKNILKHLTPEQRAAAVLKYRDGLSFDESAEKLNLSKSAVMGIVQDAKNSLKASGVNLGYVFACIDRVYSIDKEKPDEYNRGSFEIEHKTFTAEDEFNTNVNELKEFFNTRTTSMNTLSDHGIDDNDEYDDQNSEEIGAFSNAGKAIDDTASSAKLIMAAALSAESGKKKHDEKFNPVTYWVKRIAIILALAILGFGISVGVMTIRSKNNTPANTPEPVETETVEPEETEEPEEPQISEEPVAEPEPEDDGSIGTAYVLVTDLTMRTGPGIAYEQAGFAEAEHTYTVYERAEADGYTWYRVADNTWVPDLEGQFITFAEKGSE